MMRVAAAFCLLAVTLPAAHSVSISDAASKAAEASLSKTETQASVSACPNQIIIILLRVAQLFPAKW
jgi:hypothetical protein